MIKRIWLELKFLIAAKKAKELCMVMPLSVPISSVDESISNFRANYFREVANPEDAVAYLKSMIHSQVITDILQN